jgi:hypothetical protein
METRRVFGSVRKAGDATMDFIVADDPLSPPAMEPRRLVSQDACNSCHNDLQLHGSNRYSVTGCIVCHVAGSEDEGSDTDPGTTPGVTVHMGNMIHQIHRGIDLPSVTATANGSDPYRYIIRGYRGTEHDFSEVGFPVIPDAITACDACHVDAADPNQIYHNPSRADCGGCHEDIDFDAASPVAGLKLDPDDPNVAAGTLTVADLLDPAYRVAPGGVTHTAINDSGCAFCHSWTSVRDVHMHSTDPAAEGTEPVMEILSVAGMTGGGGAYFQVSDAPVVTFRVTVDGLPVPLTDMNNAYAIVAGPTSLYQTIIPAYRLLNGGVLDGSVADNLDGTYTWTSPNPFPEFYPAQLNTLGEPPAEQIFPFEEGWGQQYTAAGTPLDDGLYTISMYGRRITPIGGDREPIATDTIDVQFGPTAGSGYSGTVTSEACNACHGVLAFHGNQREGVESCLACHTAGTQDAGTYESVDLRIMTHKIHNARNLPSVLGGTPYELNGHYGITDFSHMLISAMPGEAAECQVCHVNDDWKYPPLRENMRTWMVVCTSCHDGDDTVAHVDAMTEAGTFNEYCNLCHGPGTLFSVEGVHASP